MLFVLSVLVLCLVLSCFVLPRVEWSGSGVGRVRDSGKSVGACVDEKKNDDRNHNRVSAGNSSSRRHTPPYSSHSLTLRTVPNSSHHACLRCLVLLLSLSYVLSCLVLLYLVLSCCVYLCCLMLCFILGV